jgi:transcriptional regulator with XRE-family HTH domain
MITYKPPAHKPCETLRKIREEKGLTQTQLSRMLILAGYNVSASYISRFELGYNKPWANAKKGISEVLDIEENILFG